jgi:predicted ATPase/class 3 adenylate cyclase
VADDARVPEQPSGTVTLVFTDIEGSTRLLHELGPDAYREALGEHRRVVREAFAAGYEAGTQGDAFFYAFASAEDAVVATERALADLARGPIRIRVGIHTGEPVVDPPDYVGVDVHLCARVRSVGHGGQVLVTRATRDLVDISLADLGEHRLKDIADPVWLYQLGTIEFPPLRSLNNTNLPAPASTFLGREAELDKAAQLLAGCRLLTISGPGGAGKTRFSIELAARQLSRFPNGVFWVPLAALRDPALVTGAIAQILGSPNGLVDHIGPKRMLLLLDNFEQVVAAAPGLSALLADCPGLSLLVTSRELLRVHGEVDFPLPSLAVSESVELFCERAGCRPDPTVEHLCDRLEGLPLAIELAAARTTVLTPGQLLDRLGRRLDLLHGGRDSDPRQRTLRATIEWSYGLLDEDEARLFRSLAVFAGGWTLEIAEAACDGDIDTLQALTDKSLVRRTDARFWMLETIREFALDELRVRGELESARRAYFDWMVQLAEEAKGELEGAEQRNWLLLLDDEYGNVREVVTLALEQDTASAIAILIALDRYWWKRPREAVTWFERALAAEDRVQPVTRAHLLRVAATTSWFHGHPELTLELGRQGLAIFETLDDERGISLMYSRLVPPLITAGQTDEAAELADLAVALHRRLGQEVELAIILHISGSLYASRGELPAAAEVLEEAVALARKTGDTQPMTRALLILAEVRWEMGDQAEDAAHIVEALETAHEHRDLIDTAFSLASLAVARTRRGDPHGAAIYWGAVEHLDEELGQSQFRRERPGYEAELTAEVLADAEGRAVGRSLATAEVVELARREVSRA